MSASREKKQRQGAAPADKAAKVQQEQAARRRQTIVYAVTGGVIAVLVAALLVWRTGFFQARTAAATVGGETLTAAELSYYYNSIRSNFVTYGMLDTSKDDDEQFYNETEGQTYRDFFMETALTNAKQHLALSKEAENAGHTEAEIKDSLDAQIDSLKSTASSNGISYSAYLKALYGDYITPAVYEKLTTRLLMASLVVDEKYEELFNSYSQADLEDYYNAEDHADNLDTIEYSSLYFPIPTVNNKDEEGNDLSEEELQKLEQQAEADTKANAEEALEAVRGGATFQSQVDKYNLTGTNNADHTKRVGTATINTTFSDELFALDEDECGLVETDNGYYVIAFHGRYLNDEPTRDVRHIAILADAATEEHEDHDHTEAPTDEAWAAAREKMDAVEAEWNAGDKTEEAFAALAEKYNVEGVDDDLVSRIPSTNTTLVPEFLAWTFDASRKPGDTEVIQHSAAESDSNKYWAYHLMYYVGENEPVWMNSVRSTLATEARQEWIDQLSESFPTAELSGANYFGK